MKNLPGYVVKEQDPKNRQILYEALAYDAGDRLTICELFRFMYDTVYDLPDGEIKNDLTEKLIDAMGMAKKMNARLAHYRRTYTDKTGRAGSSIMLIEHASKRKRIRRSRRI